MAFTDTGHLFGEAARNQALVNPENTVFAAKRLIWQDFNVYEADFGTKYYPFKVVYKSGRPAIQVNYKGETKVLLPEEISAMVLRRLKEMAEKYLGNKVSGAVITVPAMFGDYQRQVIKDACLIAGINVVSIMNDPTAAVITYGIDKYRDEKRTITILAFNLGAGSLDVSLVEVEDGVLKVKATAGDIFFPPTNTDKRLFGFFVREFERKSGKSIVKDPQSCACLYRACEPAKCELSSTTQVSIEIESLYEGIDFHTSLSHVPSLRSSAKISSDLVKTKLTGFSAMRKWTRPALTKLS